jgi:hypothetical protein
MENPGKKCKTFGNKNKKTKDVGRMSSMRKRDWGFGRLILFNRNNKCFLETSYHLQIMAECDTSGTRMTSLSQVVH